MERPRIKNANLVSRCYKQIGIRPSVGRAYAQLLLPSSALGPGDLPCL